MRIRLASLGVLVVALTAAATAGAADECRGLQTCLPAKGPWVVVPASTEQAPGRAAWLLRCPLKGYIVAGTDARVDSRALDVSIRGETGSPVSPGVTTRDAALFTGTYAGASGRRSSFQPFIGCIPSQGGGGRSQTATGAGRAFRPAAPTRLVTATAAFGPGASAIATARCPRGTRLLAAGHALGLRLGAAPTQSLLTLLSGGQSTAGSAVRARGALAAGAPRALRGVVQAQALCTRRSP